MIVGDRDLGDTSDLFLCLSARDGETIWQVQYPAPGELDYGNQPRATPLIHGEYVYLFGAFGDLTCVDLSSGKMIWQKNLREAYATQAEYIWGMCASPLIADEKLIVNPGCGRRHDRGTGSTIRSGDLASAGGTSRLRVFPGGRTGREATGRRSRPEFPGRMGFADRRTSLDVDAPVR